MISAGRLEKMDFVCWQYDAGQLRVINLSFSQREVFLEPENSPTRPWPTKEAGWIARAVIGRLSRQKGSVSWLLFRSVEFLRAMIDLGHLLSRR